MRKDTSLCGFTFEYVDSEYEYVLVWIPEKTECFLSWNLFVDVDDFRRYLLGRQMFKQLDVVG